MATELIHPARSLNSNGHKPDFRVTAEYAVPPPLNFTEYDFNEHLARLSAFPETLSTFLGGAYTKHLNPKSGMIEGEYREFIEKVDRFHHMHGVDCYSCFKREQFGLYRISSEHATELDRLGIETRHFLTILPGSSESEGTLREIKFGSDIGKSFIFLFEANTPEIKFQKQVRSLMTAPSFSITFQTNLDLFEQLRRTWDQMYEIIYGSLDKSRNNRASNHAFDNA